MTMRWFGLLPFARVCEDTPRVHIPTGAPCGWCDEPININDNGMYFANPDSEPHHWECFMRMMVGSVGHQTDRCSCEGGHETDPPEMSRREAAKLAYLCFLASKEPLP